MAKQIIWSLKAKQELLDILEFWKVNNRSNSYSLKLYQKIQINLKYISENNYIGKPTSIKDVRVIVVSNYLLFYQVTPKQIEILSVYDGRRNPEKAI